MTLFQNPVFQTVISGVLIFLLGEILQIFFLAPLKEYKRIVGAIDNRLKYYSNVILTIATPEESIREVHKLLRELSCDLESAYKQIPCRVVFCRLRLVPAQIEVAEAAKCLIFLSNTVVDKGHVIEKNTEFGNVYKLLNIESLDK
jgi:hypothetical protein